MCTDIVKIITDIIKENCIFFRNPRTSEFIMFNFTFWMATIAQ